MDSFAVHTGEPCLDPLRAGDELADLLLRRGLLPLVLEQDVRGADGDHVIHAVQRRVPEGGADLEFFKGSGEARDLEGGGMDNVFETPAKVGRGFDGIYYRVLQWL